MGCKSFRIFSLVGKRDLLLIQILEDRHLDLRGNLVKAIMVLNWLNMLEVENF